MNATEAIMAGIEPKTQPREAFILLVKEIHLGSMKQTFGRGAVIVHDPNMRQLIVDGRRFDETRDLDILKSQAQKNPESPWIIPYSEEALAMVRGETLPEPAAKIPQKPGENMPIVQSDEDSHKTIDIRHTQVSRIKQEEKEAARKKVKTDGMEVIRGDETVEERLARLRHAKDSDLGAAAERVRLLSEAPAKMPVVKDDSLGVASGSQGAALNAGQPHSGKRADEASDNAKAAAQARKKEVSRNRERVIEEQGVDIPGVEMTHGPAPEPVADVPGQVDMRDTEIAALKAKIAEMEATKAPERVAVTDAGMAQSILDRQDAAMPGLVSQQESAGEALLGEEV